MTNSDTMEAILRAIANVNNGQATPLEDRAVTLMKGGKEGIFIEDALNAVARGGLVSGYQSELVRRILITDNALFLNLRLT